MCVCVCVRNTVGQLVTTTTHAHDGGFHHTASGAPAGTVFITSCPGGPTQHTATIAGAHDDPSTPVRRTPSQTSQAAALGLQQLQQRAARQQAGYRQSMDQPHVVVGMNAAAAYTANGHVVDIN